LVEEGKEILENFVMRKLISMMKKSINFRNSLILKVLRNYSLNSRIMNWMQAA
jgi:hypothetical protein